jgi:hypothetical protein
MGWGVRDYPSAPREGRFYRCQAHGCEIASEADIYRCAAPDCPHERLCVGCIWQCDGCGEDFCERHIDTHSDACLLASLVWLLATSSMQRTPVQSSSINAIGYDPKSRTLHVEFASGRTYEYKGVEPHEHEALVSAKSIGSHFSKFIRPVYNGRES